MGLRGKNRSRERDRTVNLERDKRQNKEVGLRRQQQTMKEQSEFDERQVTEQGLEDKAARRRQQQHEWQGTGSVASE